MKKWEDALFLKEELENTKRALLSARTVREIKFLQNKLRYLQQRIKEVEKV